MELLINRTDIANLVQISDTCEDNVLNQEIGNAQLLDVMDLLGEELYNDLLRNFDDAKYSELLKGGDYLFNAITYTFPGLKTVLVYYTNARYKKFGSFIDTPFSIVEKINPESSTPVSGENKQSLYKLNKQIAFKHWLSVRKFLDRNATTYPLWGSSCTKITSTFRIQKIV